MRNFLERQMWIEFGVHPDGRVDVCDVDGREIVTLPREQAIDVIKAHNDALERADEELRQLS